MVSFKKNKKLVNYHNVLYVNNKWKDSEYSRPAKTGNTSNSYYCIYSHPDIARGWQNGEGEDKYAQYLYQFYLFKM